MHAELVLNGKLISDVKVVEMTVEPITEFNHHIRHVQKFEKRMTIQGETLCSNWVMLLWRFDELRTTNPRRRFNKEEVGDFYQSIKQFWREQRLAILLGHYSKGRGL